MDANQSRKSSPYLESVLSPSAPNSLGTNSINKAVQRGIWIVCLFVYIHMCVFIRVQIVFIYTCEYVCVCICMYAYVYVCMFMYMYVCEGVCFENQN